MKYLLFKLTNKNISYAIVSPKVLYLLNDSEYSILKNAGSQEILKEVRQIAITQILKLVAIKQNKEVTVQDLEANELVRLGFELNSTLKQFLISFPDFKRDIDKSKTRIAPLNALLVMLFSYSFIWAGTRPTSADINPEGIRWRIAYFNVKFLEWLNGFIGQTSLLIIGTILLFTLIYLIFKPELWKLFGHKIIYSNSTIEEK